MILSNSYVSEQNFVMEVILREDNIFSVRYFFLCSYFQNLTQIFKIMWETRKKLLINRNLVLFHLFKLHVHHGYKTFSTRFLIIFLNVTNDSPLFCHFILLSWVYTGLKLDTSRISLLHDLPRIFLPNLESSLFY